jgi:hypothetical protein
MTKYNLMPERNAAAPAVSSSWQKQLTALLGLTPDGRPKLRLVWGQEATHFFMERERLKYIRSRSPVFTGWQESKKDELTGETVVVNHYPPTLEPPEVPDGHLLQPTGRMETIGIDRWFIELWRGPRIASGGHTVEAWEKTYRYKHLYDPTKGIYRNVDVHGEYPHVGEYAKSPYAWPWMIARHCRQKSCCDDREAQGYVCLGEYRAPEQRDIGFLAYLVAEKNKQPYVSEYDQIAPIEAVAQEVSEELWRNRRAEEDAEMETRYRLNQIRRRQTAQPVHFDIRRNA